MMILIVMCAVIGAGAVLCVAIVIMGVTVLMDIHISGHGTDVDFTPSVAVIVAGTVSFCGEIRLEIAAQGL